MLPGVLNGRVKRRERLHDHFPFDIAAARAARHLREQLKGAFAGTKIGNVQAEIGVNNPHQRHVGEVQPFGDHLRADENVDFAGPKIAQNMAVIFLPFHRVGVHAPDASLRKHFAQGLLHLFRAQAGVADFGVAASFRGAGFGHLGFVAANVAAEFLRLPMVGQSHAAIGAAGHVTALGALQGRRVAPAVEEQHRLLMFFDALAHGLR